MSVRGLEPPHDDALNVAPLPLGYTDEFLRKFFELFEKKIPELGFEPR